MSREQELARYLMGVSVTLLAVTGLLVWRTMELDEARARVIPYLLKECAPPQKPLRLYPLEEQV